AVVHAEERKLDDEARSIGAHADDMDKKLYSGTVVSPRELQAMQADVDMLRRRRTELEDQELEVMEQREALDQELAALDAALATWKKDAKPLRDTTARTEAEIAAEVADKPADRPALAAPVPAALLADYEKRRAQNRGAGAARLVGTTCQ